jgi:hypothetical protein
VVNLFLNSSGTQFPMKIGLRRKSQSNRFAIFYGLALTAFLLLVMNEAKDVIADYPIEFVLFFTIAGLSIYGQLLSLQREASIHFVSFTFCFLFLSIAPIVQIAAYTDPIFRIDHWVLWAAVNSLAFTGIGIVVTYLNTSNMETQSRPRVVPTDVNYLFVLLVTAAIAMFSIALFNAALFTNREEFGAVLGNMFPDSSIMTLARTVLFDTPFFGAIIGLRSAIYNSKKIWIALFSAALLLAGIINNPLVNPRYQLAGLAFFTIDYMFYGKRTKLLAVLLIVGTMLAPLFQVFRYADEESSASNSASLFSQTFLSMDYDAFQLSCYTMLTVDKDGLAWGSNLLGAALFFVPRSLWPDKPLQTSWIIFETIDHSKDAGTNNLSTPLMAEAYFAFGWPGALAISFLFWWGISKVTYLSRKDPTSWMFLWRCLFAGLALIFLRGTLIVGVSAVVGAFAVAAIPAFLIKHRFRTVRRYAALPSPRKKLG